MLAQQHSIKEKRGVKLRITNNTEWTKYRQKLKENMNRIWRTIQHEEIQYSQMVKKYKGLRILYKWQNNSETEKAIYRPESRKCNN